MYEISARSSVGLEFWFPKPKVGGSSPLGRAKVYLKVLGKLERKNLKCDLNHIY